MGSILYYIIIFPIELLVEVVFTVLNLLLDNPGLSIVGVSLVINFLILPMYRRSDALQDKEREAQKNMSRWVKHIRKTFHGDEQFMMLQEYYRQNNYKPVYALRGSVSLLLQIPFFIAAYHYLSNLTVLRGTSFLFIADMGKPDGLLKIGALSVNLLPFLMTGINFLSGAIYTKGFALKDKLQLYIMALVFLVLLYTSPAGLVLYWTCNNTFSLVKNIFFKKLKHPHETFAVISLAAGIFMACFVRYRYRTFIWAVFALLVLVVTMIPSVRLLRAKIPAEKKRASACFHRLLLGRDTLAAEKRYFFCGCLYLALLTGFLIPSAVIGSSPSEFIFDSLYQDPLHYIIYSCSIAAGCFLLWASILFSLMNEGKQRMASFAVWLTAGVFTVDYMFFGRHLGTMTSELGFERAPDPTLTDKVVNLAAIAAVILLFLLLWLWKRKAAAAVYTALIAGTCVLAVINMSSTETQLAGMSYLKAETGTQKEDDKILHLSRNGRNVIVFMLDRAISGYVPYMMKEKPELAEQFSDFTYYPNTLSFGWHTNTASPALFGGYEYTPDEINKRASDTLKDKQDEALKVMPVLFSGAGYDVTVCDPPYAGYQYVSDLSIYDDCQNVHAYHTMGRYSSAAGVAYYEKNRKRNFFCYSIFKVMPVFTEKALYSEGDYLSAVKETDLYRTFLESYDVLTKLPELTAVDDGSKNQFLMMDNDTTHDPCKLQLPDYTPAEQVDNTAYEAQWKAQFTVDGQTAVHMEAKDQQEMYYINMAAFLQLGKWFDYLKEQGVWDNTRIILVSDHGHNLQQFDYMRMLDETLDVQCFNPLLMVKDFSENSDSLTTVRTFMTNADVPTLATEDLIPDPSNPFTGKKLDSSAKTAHPQVICSDYLPLMDNDGYSFKIQNEYSVHDDIFREENWKKVK